MMTFVELPLTTTAELEIDNALVLLVYTWLR